MCCLEEKRLLNTNGQAQLDGKRLDGFTSYKAVITKESLVAEGNVIFGKFLHF